MTKKEWELLFIDAMNDLRNQAFVPYDTGNLKFNAIKGVWVDNNTYRIYIDEKVAPYVYYTQEKWKKGTNPNEGWVEKAVNHISNFIARKLQGEIKR